MSAQQPVETTVAVAAAKAESSDYRGADPDQAKQLYLRIVVAAESLRLEGGLPDTLRRSYFATVAPAYKSLAALDARSGDFWQALRAAELSKARTLLEVSSARGVARNILSADERAELSDLEFRVARLDEQIPTEKDVGARADMEARRNALSAKFAETNGALEGKYATARVGESDVRTLEAMGDLATAQFDLGKVSEGVGTYRRAYVLATAALGETTPEAMNIGHEYAGLLYRAGRYGEALAIFQRVLTATRQKFDDENRDTVATLHSIAVVLSDLGRNEDAIVIYQYVLSVLERQVLSAQPTDVKRVAGPASTPACYRRKALGISPRSSSHSDAGPAQPCVPGCRLRIGNRGKTVATKQRDPIRSIRGASSYGVRVAAECHL